MQHTGGPIQAFRVKWLGLPIHQGKGACKSFSGVKIGHESSGITVFDTCATRGAVSGDWHFHLNSFAQVVVTD